VAARNSTARPRLRSTTQRVGHHQEPHAALTRGAGEDPGLMVVSVQLPVASRGDRLPRGN
jgi:hypothetical protein